MGRPSGELDWEEEARGRSLHEFWENWNAEEMQRVEERGHAQLIAEREVQAEEEELRGEEPEAE